MKKKREGNAHKKASGMEFNVGKWKRSRWSPVRVNGVSGFTRISRNEKPKAGRGRERRGKKTIVSIEWRFRNLHSHQSRSLFMTVQMCRTHWNAYDPCCLYEKGKRGKRTKHRLGELWLCGLDETLRR